MRVYQTFNRTEAHLVIHITQDKGTADLCVYPVSSRGSAYNESRWYITKNRHEADKIVFFGSRGMARLNVNFVKEPAQAGWMRNHLLQGSLAR